MNSYDLVPYESHPFSQTHPSRLATIGSLFGMRPAPISRCRVLELGSAAGGNLIPMAVQYPQSQFIGLDLSSRHVQEGQETIARLGLMNIELRHADIKAVDDAYGKFDYLICHGVFSWVPDDVQEAIFQIAARNLHAHGIAYISYNTYPGWHMRGLIRAMMRYHAEHYSTHKIRTGQARALLDFLAGSVPKDSSAYYALLRQEVGVLQRQPDHYLFHEHLEEVNEPLFFHQFIDRANKHRLQYLGEANVRSMIVSNLPEDVQKALRVLATDQIQLEQYMDFLRNRTFRETLLCHASAPLTRALDAQPLRRFWVASKASPVEDPSTTRSESSVTYRTASGYSLTTSIPLMKAAFDLLRETWPQAISLTTLSDQAIERVRQSDPQITFTQREETVLADRLMNTYVASDMIELHIHELPFTITVSERPTACPYARDQASRGAKVTNRRQEVLMLNPVQQALLPLLDGTRDRSDLSSCLVEVAEKERLTIRQGDEPVDDPQTMQTVLTRALDVSLEELARSALLIA